MVQRLPNLFNWFWTHFFFFFCGIGFLKHGRNKGKASQEKNLFKWVLPVSGLTYSKKTVSSTMKKSKSKSKNYVQTLPTFYT